MTLKGYSAIYVFLSKSGIYVFKLKQYICQITSLDFHIILDGFRCLPSGFSYLTGGNLLLGLTPEKFCKFCIFSGESRSPHRGTEVGRQNIWCVVHSMYCRVIYQSEDFLNQSVKIFPWFEDWKHASLQRSFCIKWI